MDAALAAEIAGGATVLLTPYLRSLAEGASAELEVASGEGGGLLVRRLWTMLERFPMVKRAAEEIGERYFEEDLTRQIGRLLEANAELADQVAGLLAHAQAAGAPVSGHALAERVRAERDVRVEGTSATLRDSQAGQNIVVRAAGAPYPKA